MLTKYEVSLNVSGDNIESRKIIFTKNLRLVIVDMLDRIASDDQIIIYSVSKKIRSIIWAIDGSALFGFEIYGGCSGLHRRANRNEVELLVTNFPQVITDPHAYGFRPDQA